MLTTRHFRIKFDDKYMKIENWKKLLYCCCYADLFAQVTTAKVLTADPAMPARIDPSTA